MKLTDSSAAKVGTATVKAIAISSSVSRQFMCYGPLTISAVISGTVGVEKNGNGGLTLSGVNTYTGVTSINAGKIITSKTNGSITATAEFGVNATVSPATQALNVSFTGGTPSNGATFKFFEGSTTPAFSNVVAITNSSTLRGTFNNNNSTLTVNSVSDTVLTSTSDEPSYFALDTIPDNWQKGDITIKGVVIGDGVTIIGSGAFNECTFIETVTIPYSVITIGAIAFSSCIRLTAVTIGAGVTTIGNGAFNNCQSLVAINIPYGVISIGNAVFNACITLTNISCDPNSSDFSSLTGVLYNKNQTKLVQYPAGKSGAYTNMPNTVTEIAPQSCAGSILLTAVTIPTSVTNIGNQAFSDCTVLTTCSIPINVSTIGIGIFRLCSALTSIAIDANNSYFSAIDGVLFIKDLTTLIMFPAGKTGTYAVPSTVTTIQGQAFSGASNLTSITIPDNTISIINGSTFQGCSNITSFIVPNGVMNIQSDAFRGCVRLTTVTIPSTVAIIQTAVFQSCPTLATINCNVSRNIMNTNNTLEGTSATITITINVSLNDPTWTAGVDIIGGRNVIVARTLP